MESHKLVNWIRIYGNHFRAHMLSVGEVKKRVSEQFPLQSLDFSNKFHINLITFFFLATTKTLQKLYRE